MIVQGISRGMFREGVSAPLNGAQLILISHCGAFPDGQFLRNCPPVLPPGAPSGYPSLILALQHFRSPQHSRRPGEHWDNAEHISPYPLEVYTLAVDRVPDAISRRGLHV